MHSYKISSLLPPSPSHIRAQAVTYQIVLATDSKKTYTLLLYSDVRWNSSNGHGVLVGFNAGVYTADFKLVIILQSVPINFKRMQTLNWFTAVTNLIHGRYVAIPACHMYVHCICLYNNIWSLHAICTYVHCIIMCM